MKTKYEKLPKRFKTKWLKALRSGDYEQGVTFLARTPTWSPKQTYYCCLGVACVIQGSTVKFLKRRSWIPKQAINKYNVPKQLIGENPLTEELVRRNDSKRDSFKRIANWIEKNL